MNHSILITPCLQNDFARPLGRYESLPKILHVGYEEALRLIGENPGEGPVAPLMQWAYRQPAEELSIIHIRDWHDSDDAFQQEPFRQFGVHCLKESGGAEFAFPIPETARQTSVIDSPGLNDFVGMELETAFQPFAEQELRVGLAGVWTEAEIFF